MKSNLTMKHTGDKDPSSKTKTDDTSSEPSKRSKHSSSSHELADDDNSKETSFHNLRSSRSSVPMEPAVEQTAAAPADNLGDNVGQWLSQKVVVTTVTEHVKYTFITHDLSEPLHSSELQAAVNNSVFSSEQLLSPDAIVCSSNDDKVYETSTVLESSFSPVEYVVVRAPAGVETSFPTLPAHSDASHSAGQATDLQQQLLQSLGMPESNEAIVATGSTNIDGAVTEIAAAVTAAVQSGSSISAQPPQAATTEQ